MEHHPTQALELKTLDGTSEGVRIIKVRGPLTIHNFFEFQDLTRQHPRAAVMLIDLAEVPYIDSAALGSLIGLHVSCGRAGEKYALLKANERLRSLFAMCGVDQLLVTFDSAEAAEAALL
ncbi:MAG: STAS domain-containing protein [Bryobacteraceae bacterium]